MLKQTDLPYFRTRERMERDAAAAARDRAARAAHFELAERYADRVWALEEERRRRGTSPRLVV